LRLREETMRGTVEALLSGKADLALGVSTDGSAYAGFQALPLGDVPFVFAVAPQHPLAALPEPLADAQIGPYRVVAVADTAQRGQGMSIGLLSGQDVLTVSTMEHKLEAQLMGLGCGFLPLPLAQPHALAGRLVIKRTQRGERVARVGYAWRAPRGLETSPDGAAGQGQALRWWLAQLAIPRTRHALLNPTAIPG
jgi:DNA-binding transcriptional LysR family regulator